MGGWGGGGGHAICTLAIPAFALFARHSHVNLLSIFLCSCKSYSMDCHLLHENQSLKMRLNLLGMCLQELSKM